MPSGFHEGELSVQEQAGVAEDAARLAGMLEPRGLSRGAAGFLAGRGLVVLTAADSDGALWSSPLVGPPGFLEPERERLLVSAAPLSGDPLAGLPSGQEVGLVAIDFATRRRYRVNGMLDAVTSDGLDIRVEQAYGNCPQYISPRHLAVKAPGSTAGAAPGDRLTPEDVALIGRSDTFFFGTVHPSRGADSSHRGGRPGFVQAKAGEVVWPDYPGNDMFNSFGNLAVDPRAALLFIDFAAGTALHLSGRAKIVWAPNDGSDDDESTGRSVRFRVGRTVSNHSIPLTLKEKL